MYAVFKAGGKQYKVVVGDEILLDKMGLEPKTELKINEVLMVGGEAPKFGTPFVSGAVVTAMVINEGRSKKRGFRRDFTRVVITAIAA
jgi:large subunit ribosomal protein L21